MPVSLITFMVWRRLELIVKNVLPVCMILCDLLPKASVNDLDSSQNKVKYIVYPLTCQCKLKLFLARVKLALCHITCVMRDQLMIL